MIDITRYTYDKYLDGECGILDSHCHLGLMPESGLYASAIENFSVVSCGTLPSQFDKDLIFKKDNIFVGLGFHPREVNAKTWENEISIFCDAIKKNNPQIIAEIGLDLSRSYATTKELQIKVFEQICRRVAETHDKILSIHAIKSADKVLDILQDCKINSSQNDKIIFHWFSDSCEALMRAIKMGAYFSVGPKMLATRRGHEYIRQIPENRLLIETDLPWDNEPLTPTEHYNILNDFLIELRDTKGY